LVLKWNESRGSGKEGESKSEGSKRMVWVLRKGKERAINIEGDTILRELSRELSLFHSLTFYSYLLSIPTPSIFTGSISIDCDRYGHSHVM
jgi:hypothetical protein